MLSSRESSQAHDQKFVTNMGSFWEELFFWLSESFSCGFFLSLFSKVFFAHISLKVLYILREFGRNAFVHGIWFLYIEFAQRDAKWETFCHFIDSGFLCFGRSEHNVIECVSSRMFHKICGSVQVFSNTLMWRN